MVPYPKGTTSNVQGDGIGCQPRKGSMTKAYFRKAKREEIQSWQPRSAHIPPPPASLSPGVDIVASCVSRLSPVPHASLAIQDARGSDKAQTLHPVNPSSRRNHARQKHN